MRILTANDQLAVKRAGGYRNFIRKLVYERWQAQMIDWAHPQGELHAEIARSSWRALCPFCRGGLVVEPGEPFFCPDCVMQGNGFKPMRLIWPDPITRKRIEAALLRRPNPQTRNWVPGETVEMLLAENIEHGIEVPSFGY